MKRQRILPTLFLLPSVLFLAFFLLYPLMYTVYLSLHHYRLNMPWRRGYIGLDNYLTIVQDEVFWLSVKNSVVWVVGSVSVQFLLGLALALLLNQSFRGRQIIRTLVLSPWAVSGVVAALMWTLMFNANFGVINDLLLKARIINEPIAWLSRPASAMTAVIIANIWRGIPFFAITILAALQAIPNDIYEAADIDGVSRRQRFWYITLPMIKDMLIVTTVLRAIWTFNFVDLIYTMTEGGPARSTLTLPAYVFDSAYKLTDFGYGSALSIVTIIILLTFSVIYLKLTDFDTTGEGMYY